MQNISEWKRKEKPKPKLLFIQILTRIRQCDEAPDEIGPFYDGINFEKCWVVEHSLVFRPIWYAKLATELMNDEFLIGICVQTAWKPNGI